VRRKQAGYLLLPVAVAIALIGVIAFLISSQSAIEVNLTAGELEAARAEYVAQAGLQHALRELAQQGCGPYTDLTNHPFGGDEYDTQLTHDLGATTAYSAAVDQDTWIRNDFPADTNGGSTKLHTKFQAGKIEHGLLRHDLSAIPANAAILSATAWFYLTDDHAEGPVNIHAVTADWVEADATWDSMSDNIGSAVLASIPAQPLAGVWVPLNLTSQVQAWVNGETNHGIALSTTSEGSHGQYASRESANKPYLEVIVGTPPTSPAKLMSTSKLDAGGAAAVKRDDVRLNQHPPGNLFLQLGSDAGEDAMLDSFYNLRNYGGANYMQVHDNESDWQQYPLIRFNLNRLPQAAVVHSARLELRLSSLNSPGKAMIHQVTRDWVEGTKSGGGTADGANWSTYDGTNPWASAGGDINTPVVAEIAINGGETWVSWDITSLVERWVSGDSNYGLLIKPDSALNQARFASKEDADTSLHPRLSISYSCECGQVCVAPQGKGNLLMVVVNPTTLVAEDEKAKDLLESWGYTVSVISESANQSTYDAAVAANDVVLISETVNSNSVGTKLVNAPIGVVSQDGDYNPDLGLASGAALKIGGGIDIVSTDHYITRPFAVGTHRIYAADMEQAIVSGSLTADQQTLAEIGGDGSLVVLDKGEAMEGGGTAAGRRVILPLGTQYRFNWDYLNANGRLLVQRALEWGADSKLASAGSLLMVVPSPASLNAQDSSKKTLIESWGYTVTLIDDSDSQANIDAAAAANNVIYVSASISGGALADKLTGSPTPIVNEFSGKLDNFGFASNTGSTTTTDTFTSSNAAHYIGQPFGGSGVTHFTTSLSMPVPSGTLAPDLETAGESSGAVPALVTLDTGAQRWDGNPAPARRVHLPFGAATADQLTDDGKTLMLRAIEWGAGAENPDFSTELLFVVADPASLTAYESAKKTLIESWGYTVNLIDDADSVTNFAAAFATNGVVYVSGEVSDSAIGSKLIKAPLGIVNEQISLHDELLLSTSAGTNDFNSVFVIDNTHYITEGINTGWHTIATVNQPLNALEGTLAPGMTNLAEVWISGATYDFGLAVVDTGGQLNGGEIAAGRRAQLPWGTAGFDFSALNANGQNLMQRAIEWAGGAEIDLSPIAHWKLDDAPGSTAIDSVGGNDATLNGNPAWTTGVADGALEFDGTGDYATTDNNFTPPPVGTVLFWMKVPGSPASHGRILGLDDTWEIRHVTTGTPDGIPYGLVFDLGVSGVNTEFVTTVTLDTPDQWYFVAATYDTNNDAYQVYLDGVLHKSGTYPSALAVPADNPLSLGTRTGSSNYFDGILDDVRVYDRVLGAAEIEDLYNASAPVAKGYTELYEPWSATVADDWETVSLASLGVPANAVVEVAVINADGGRENYGGVRAVGSSLERRFHLQEAEAGGIDTVTLHVQADASSQIQHYVDRTDRVSLVALGYWTGASYVELFETFSTGTNNSWVSEDVSGQGLAANQVAEVVVVNTSSSNERLAGLRPVGAGYQRRFTLHEAEMGGIDTVSMMVTTNGDTEVEVYASNAGDVEYTVVGYWATPPGTYTATGGAHGSVSAPGSWETIDLSSYGVPADSIAQFVLANENQSAENSMRVREVGSTINNRALLLHEAESGGSDLGSLHANVNASQQVQWAAQQGSTNGFFYPVGWWVLTP
jgi:type II secretory pathway pseudopilin PulG